jgi:hypothetical protein
MIFEMLLNLLKPLFFMSPEVGIGMNGIQFLAHGHHSINGDQQQLNSIWSPEGWGKLCG